MSPSALQDVCRAVADPTRRAILDRLAAGEVGVNELAVEFPMSRPAISKHLRVLREARLVRERKDGRRRLYRLQPAPLAEIDRWLTRYRTLWAAHLHDLKRRAEARARAEPLSPEPGS